MKRPPRFVLATPICDGHDVAICAVTRRLRALGAQAVYIGFNKNARDIVKAAVEEDAMAIALSTYNGGHMSFIREVIRETKRQGIPGIPLFCGGGGTILQRDVAPLERLGVTRVYRPPMDLTEACRDMLARTRKLAGKRRKETANGARWLDLSRRLTRAELDGAARGGAGRKHASAGRGAKDGKRRTGLAPVWAVSGRGGAGKSTLLDELVLRFLAASKGEVAVLSVDPTLADRIRMLHCYSPRVFVRSLALEPGEEAVSRAAPLIECLRRGDFEIVLVESVGLGQNDLGVAPLADGSVFCMTPEYGTDVQLEKEALLRRSDIVVMNKGDYPQAEAKARRVRQFLGEDRELIVTRANRHGDAGVSELYRAIARRAGLSFRDAETDGAGESAPDHGEEIPFSRRAYLGGIVETHEGYYEEMEREVHEAASDPRKAATYRRRYEELWKARGFSGDPQADGGSIEDGVLWREQPNGERVPVARRTTCDIWVPAIGLPPRDASTPELVRYLYKQNVPGEFPFTEGVYPYRRAEENPIRMFAGLGLPETTNERFHLLAERGGGPPRLSTAFDSLTLYGLDSDEPGALAKVGEGGVAVDTIDDMLRLYDRFDLERSSVSMTINGPAPTLLALYLAAARRRGFDWKKLRGTVQTDILKEIQAQNECIFPLEISLRLITDMVEFTMERAPRWYPLSISGYHIGEAGANPIQELAFTLANGFTYVEVLRHRGLSLEEFTRRFSFFFTSGSELEFNVLGRVARRVWAVALERFYGVRGAGRRFKFHSQTSGRSLQDVEPLHNLARVTLQAEHALHNNTNSLHTNSYKETYSTPEEDDVLLAMGCQQIPLLESGDLRFTENLHQGAYGLSCLEDEVERAVHRIFREIDRQGGVLAAIENEYFRSVIQEEVQKEHRARERGDRVIIGVNYLEGSLDRPRGKLVTVPSADKRRQAKRTGEFKRKHRKKAGEALRRLQEVARSGGNLFEELIETVEVATVGQITHALWDVCGRYRPSM